MMPDEMPEINSSEEMALDGRGDVACLNLVHREVMDLHHELLLDNMEPWKIARELMGVGVIKSFHCNHLKAVSDEGNRAVARVLLAFLWRMGSRGYVPLVSALHRTGQSALAFTLTKTEIEVRRLFPPYSQAHAAHPFPQPAPSVATFRAIDAEPSTAIEAAPSTAIEAAPSTAIEAAPSSASDIVRSAAPENVQSALAIKPATPVASATQTYVSVPPHAEISFPPETPVSPPTPPWKYSQPPQEESEESETQTSLTWAPDEDVPRLPANSGQFSIETQTSFISLGGGEALKKVSKQNEELSETTSKSEGSQEFLNHKRELEQRLEALEEAGERRIWDLEKRVDVLERAVFSEDAQSASEAGSGWN